VISAHFVKSRLLELVATRSHFEGAALQYGPPEAPSDLAGDHPLFSQRLGFDIPEGEMRVDEMCGPTVQEYFEEYGLDVVLEVVARTRDATPEAVEDNKAWLLWELTQSLQDPTLSFVAADDTRISQVYVTIGESLGFTGWLNRGGVNLAATRQVVTLEVDAKILNEV